MDCRSIRRPSSTLLVNHGATPTAVLGGPSHTVKANMDTVVDCGLVERLDGEVRLTAFTMKALRADMVLHSLTKCHRCGRRVAVYNHPGAFVVVGGSWLETTAASRECGGASAVHGWGRQDLVCSDRVCPQKVYVDVAPRGGF